MEPSEFFAVGMGSVRILAPPTSRTPYLQGRRLSPRELQCLKLSAAGLSGEDIGNKLSISPRTVQNHFDSIRSKLGAVNRQQLLHFATRSGLLTE